MLGWVESGLLMIATVLFTSALLPRLRTYRSLLWVAARWRRSALCFQDPAAPWRRRWRIALDKRASAPKNTSGSPTVPIESPNGFAARSRLRGLEDSL